MSTTFPISHPPILEAVLSNQIAYLLELVDQAMARHPLDKIVEITPESQPANCLRIFGSGAVQTAPLPRFQWLYHRLHLHASGHCASFIDRRGKVATYL